MTIKYERVSMSLNVETIKEVNSRVVGRNSLSHILDAALTRHFSLMRETKQQVIEQFTPQEIKDIAYGVRALPDLRSVKLPMLRLLVQNLAHEGAISKALSEKIDALTLTQFSALLDLIDR